MAATGDLRRFCEQHGIRLVVAFGSAVHPDLAPAARDLDLAVSWEPNSDRDVMRLLSDLMTVLGLDAVDVMDLDRAGVVARDQALGRGELLYESEAGRFDEEQVHAMARRADTRWLRDLELRILAR